MKKLALVLGLLVALLMLASAVWAAENVLHDSVDIGDLNSESGHNLVGWGPIEPATSGGVYGHVDDCRCIWEPGTGDANREATLELKVHKGSAKTLKFSHLDGFADDSFEVYVLHANGRWVKVDTYTDGAPAWDLENWFDRTVDLELPDLALGRDMMVKFKATGPAWSAHGKYGQVCFDWIELYGNGAPR